MNADENSEQERGPNTSMWTVAKYFEEIYLPHKTAKGVTLAAGTIKNYRRMVRWLGGADKAVI